MSSRSITLIYVLFIYILLQFVWWTYLIVDLNLAIFELKADVQAVPTSVFDDEKSTKIFMVLGEGSVFLLLLIIGFFQVIKAIKKQQKLALQENNFLLSVTHELNSPLTSIKLFLETLTRRTIPQDKQLKLIKNAQAETARLEATVGNILQLNKVEGAQHTYHFQLANFSEFLEKFVREKKAVLPEGATLEADIQPNVELKFDEGAMQMVLNNLFDNAMKYAAPNPYIEIRLEKLPSAINLCISDNGKGILDKQAVLEKFYREENELTRKSKGTGIGLYLVKNLAKLHKAELSITDNHPKGAIINLRFNK